MSKARPLRSPTPTAPERILAYGTEGTFKTTNALNIAQRCLADNETMFIIDTDGAVPILAAENGMALREDWLDGENYGTGDEAAKLVRYSANDWETWRDAVGDAFNRAGRGDWIVLDTMTWPWGDIQEWYLQKMFGKDLSMILLDHRADQMKNNKGQDGGAGAIVMEWPYINSVWVETWRRPLMRAAPRGIHVYATAHAKGINTERDGAEIKSTYGSVRMKPDGQNKLGKDARTVLYLEQGRKRERRITTVKDQGRELEGVLEGETYDDFAVNYLMKVAKWRPGKGEQ